MQPPCFSGCTWETSDDGITGSVHHHPLEDWSEFHAYRAPDPAESDGTFPVEWGRIGARVAEQKENGALVHGGLPHGHIFLRLQDIRGYENLIFDMHGVGFPAWLLIVANTISFWRVRPAAGAWRVPYPLWMTFAGALNYWVWQLNPGLL
ncbi:MAG: tryptophan-rich sensory protein [Candidatus Pacebacteria bacterium]|nr:tryptophan-rich sensory protein [Candidatus Paceibacterota bacterium]